MTISDRIDAFILLGEYLNNLTPDQLEELQLQAAAENPWFTPESVKKAIDGIGHFLNKETLEEWVSAYNIKDQPKLVGVVMAGNIPLVGFHDLLSVLISGNILKAKLSSKDTSLMRHLINKLVAFNKEFESHIIIADQLKSIEAIIATGSDNSSRYFDYYFSKYPNIIRKNRTSCAVLDEQCTVEDYKALGNDIFRYFGLGCRNVSKLYVPVNYNFEKFFQSIEGFNTIIHHHKYNNNYDYNKSIYLVNKETHLDNGFLLLRKDKGLVSPISVLFYEEYTDESDLEGLIMKNKEKIQCIVSREGSYPNSYAFGTAQFPAIDDYADGVDTMKFLTEL